MAKSKNKENKADNKPQNQGQFVFDRQNYILMLIGLAIITIGFVLMYGKEDIYDFRKITLAPIVVLAGFALEIYAIMKKPSA